MSAKERERLIVMTKVVNKEMMLREASERLGLSYRQARRVHKRFAEHGARGLAHRSRGRASNRALPEDFKQSVLALRKEHYGDYGPTLAAEVLDEQHGLTVRPETLRRWLHEKGELIPKTRRRVHRRRRARRKHFGSMVQMDGSHHAWFEERGESCCLMVAVDDATGRTLAQMSGQETLHAAYTLLRKWIARYGVPEALYVDRKSVYAGDAAYAKRGKQTKAGPQGDFIRACRELGIRLIFAHSPQAKGRVERKNGVLQDRLVKELRRKKIDTIQEANALLDAFTDRLDEKHAVAPQEGIDRHRRAPAADLLDRTLSRESKRSVQSDWTISFNGQALQILAQANQPHPRDRVVVRECYDGSLEIVYRGHRLKWNGANNQPDQSVRPPRGGRTAHTPKSPGSPGGHF